MHEQLPEGQHIYVGVAQEGEAERPHQLHHLYERDCRWSLRGLLHLELLYHLRSDKRNLVLLLHMLYIIRREHMLRHPPVVSIPPPLPPIRPSVSGSLSKKNVINQVASPRIVRPVQQSLIPSGVPMTQSIISGRQPPRPNAFTTVYSGETPNVRERVTITYSEIPPQTSRSSQKPPSLEDNGFSFGPVVAGLQAHSKQQSTQRVSSPKIQQPLPRSLVNLHIPGVQTDRTALNNRVASPTSRLLSPVSMSVLSGQSRAVPTRTSITTHRKPVRSVTTLVAEPMNMPAAYTMSKLILQNSLSPSNSRTSLTNNMALNQSALNRAKSVGALPPLGPNHRLSI